MTFTGLFCFVESLGSVVAKVFEAAVKKKSWDHFTKAQRKLITQWRELVEEVRQHDCFCLPPGS